MKIKAPFQIGKPLVSERLENASRAFLNEITILDNVSIYKDVLALSSGTIATLTGVNSYEELDRLHQDFCCLAYFASKGRLSKILPNNPTWVDIVKLHPSVRKS